MNGRMNPIEILKRHCAGKAYRIVLAHSESVKRKALEIADRVPELMPDKQFIAEAALLHDIGIVLTNAPALGCTGTEPYIKHGILGGELLRKEGLPRHARVCERHTGVGITAREILANGLPLPPRDLIPETVEEEIICLADKFFSKSHGGEHSISEVREELSGFGQEHVRKFDLWCEKYKINKIRSHPGRP